MKTNRCEPADSGVLVVGGYPEATESEIRARYVFEPDPALAVQRLRRERFDVVITGLHIQPVDGIAVLEAVSKWSPDAIRIVTSQTKDPQKILACYRMGAEAFIYEPFDIAELEGAVARLVTERRQMGELSRLRKVSQSVEMGGLFGTSEAIREIQNSVDQVASTRTTVLISGESGTGKGVVAKLLHRRSSRSSGPFIAVNCGAIPESIIESELFGHERGAFTGASNQSVGLFEQADGGTLFLDEIGELSASAQVKLLKVIEERRLRRIGGSREIEVDVRLVAATNRDLREKVRDRSFREDLYYRLNIFSIHVPPLRDRRSDIPELANRFNEVISAEMGVRHRCFSRAAVELLMRHDFPGNVRELRNIVERAIISSAGRECIEIPRGMDAAASSPGAMPPQAAEGGIEAMIDQAAEIGLDAFVGGIEDAIVRGAIERSGGNITRAADLLKIKRTTLIARMAAKPAP